jgi:hypothetical protein
MYRYYHLTNENIIQTYDAQETLWKLPDFMPVSLDVMLMLPGRNDTLANLPGVTRQGYGHFRSD